MLSLLAFTFTKPDFYQIYRDLFEKVEEKDENIKQYVVKLSDGLSGVVAYKVRPFQVIPVKEEH